MQGSRDYEGKVQIACHCAVDINAMDKMTNTQLEESNIDEYTEVEDSYNRPVLHEDPIECVDYYGQGITIYSSLEICADAVNANIVNSTIGLGYFFYSKWYF